MKSLVAGLVIVVLGGLILTSLPATADDAEEGAYELTGEVAAVDPVGKRLSLKGEPGEPNTVIRTKGEARKALSDVEAGDRVKLECVEDKKGRVIAVGLEILE